MPFGFLRVLWSVVGSSFVSGIAWSFGAGVADVVLTRYSKVMVSMFKRNRLLFHPKITLTAGLLALASFCTLIVSIATPLHKVPVIGKYADAVVGTAMCAGPVALWVATYGRSPASAVDNNNKPK